MKDLAPPEYLMPALLAVIALLTVASLTARPRRHRRSFALLALLVAALATLTKFAAEPLSNYASLALFLGMFVVFRFLGKFDSPE